MCINTIFLCCVFGRDERRAKAMKLPISIDDIIYTPVEKFTELLSKHRLTEPQLQLVKDIRRRGKNKVSVFVSAEINV